MNSHASSTVRSPTNHDGDELCVSADRGPCPHVAVAERATVLNGDVLCLGVAERPISSAWSVRQGRSRMARSWYSAQAAPKSTNNLPTVSFATPVMRTVARASYPQPATRLPEHVTLWSAGSYGLSSLTGRTERPSDARLVSGNCQSSEDVASWLCYQRARAVFLAISERSADESLAALALPPLRPAARPLAR
jgi:hypothetical protein